MNKKLDEIIKDTDNLINSVNDLTGLLSRIISFIDNLNEEEKKKYHEKIVNLQKKLPEWE